MDTLTWSEFVAEAEAFCKIAEQLGDNWSLYRKNDSECNTYLIYKQKIPNELYKKQPNVLKDNVEKTNAVNTELAVDVALLGEAQLDSISYTDSALDMLEIEYHIVYSISYQVPVLYFRIYHSDGSLVSLEDAWRIFRCAATNAQNVAVADSLTHTDMLSILTQMDHPVLFKPFLALHPCRTAVLLAQAGKSRNRILTFISVMGPYVRLHLCNEYGLQFGV